MEMFTTVTNFRFSYIDVTVDVDFIYNNDLNEVEKIQHVWTISDGQDVMMILFSNEFKFRKVLQKAYLLSTKGKSTHQKETGSNCRKDYDS